MAVPFLDLKAQFATIRDDVLKAVTRVFDDQAFVLGKYVEAFEHACAEYLGVKHAIGVSNGSDALLLALMAAGVKPGDEVIVPAFTFFATAGAVARLNAVPVFCDVHADTFNIDLKSAATKVSGKTRAIIPVDLYGQCADMEGVMDLARAHNLAVIEDAAQAFGATRNGKQAGTFAHYGCYSFYPTKNLGGAGDGGMVTSNDDELADRIRLLRTHGERPRYYNKQVGICGRLDALQAVVLHVKLEHLDAWNRRRAEVAARYNAAFAGHARIKTPPVSKGNTHIYHQYTIRIPDRDRVQGELSAKGVGCGVYYPVPLHLQECFKQQGGKPGDLPVSEQLCAEALSLPVFDQMTNAQIDEASKAVIEALG
ncbi:MAG: DegT/DnrJ/EryC1/StrS family aminotransferase [Planctomycetes bacterium]|nr:DegT/DnrJ/EryC1/StrS family aminotransferase [Planctomycetota bacterium]MCW8135740.1 DegT/DnrJ/EryC1/StrS family aminotransferase [Planctomycetota bacterium]